MKNLLADFNNEQASLIKRNIPNFRPGDTIKVSMHILDGTNDRIQCFEGICIKKRNRLFHSSFTLRKVSQGESILLQVFTYSPSIKSIEVVRLGKVRRAKLYYMINLFGKAARVKERMVAKQ